MDREPPTPGVLFTSRLSYDGPDRIDITRRGDHAVWSALAPSAKLLGNYQRIKRTSPERATEAWSSYVCDYIGEMRVSRVSRHHDWQAAIILASAKGLTLACYCPRPERCHRIVAVRLLIDAAGAQGTTLRYGGERDESDEKGAW